MTNDIRSDVTSSSSTSIDSLITSRDVGMRGNSPLPWPTFLKGQTGQPVRVLLIDDDPHIRLVIAQELVADMRIDLIAQAGSMKEGRRLIALHDFDVMLIDLSLGDGTGFDLIEQMKTLRPAAEAVVISVTEDEQHGARRGLCGGR